ncbi:MAG: thioredoxin domain-containing protein [Patescibacteria group bacterium]
MSFIQKILPVFLFTVSLAILGFALFSISEPEDNAIAASSLPPRVTEEDHALGPQDAPVTIIEYSDFQCPYCAQLEPVLNEIMQDYPNQIKLVYRHFPLEGIHPLATPSAIASEAAGKQGKFWEMHDLLFANQDTLDIGSFTSFAKLLQLDMSRFNSDSKNQSLMNRVKGGISEAKILNLSSTPTLFINDKKVVGAQSKELIESVISKEIEKMAKQR